MQENSYHISLGTNLGDRAKNLDEALRRISTFAHIEKQSSIYETEPVGYKDQGKFLNMVIEIKYPSDPLKLLTQLQRIEMKMGRIKTFKNGPRIIDLDILLNGNNEFKHKNLQIPHPRMNDREFVQKPLNEIWIEKKLKN